ncbi:hypothetical protein F1735_12355 [Massilia sp. CCM 8694]|uniref:Uncharacterized protein n=1 Tax=Massilia genomosp. 1 TaxID=2609280 RepID=A0ABX0MJY0_9BURK|nr:hypothetical protein [Massilia genomosp. 1]
MPGEGATRQGAVWRGLPWRGLPWRGPAWHGPALTRLRGILCCRIVIVVHLTSHPLHTPADLPRTGTQAAQDGRWKHCLLD